MTFVVSSLSRSLFIRNVDINKSVVVFACTQKQQKPLRRREVSSLQCCHARLKMLLIALDVGKILAGLISFVLAPLWFRP